MNLRGVTIFCMALLQNSLGYDDIHNFMSGDQIRQVFQTDVDSVQEHEVVKINFLERLHRRQISDEQALSFRAFGDDINLSLNSRDSTLFGERTPIYLARSIPGFEYEIEWTSYIAEMNKLGTFLQDPRHFASLLVSKRDSDGKRTINGHIGSKKLVIRSLPENVAHEYLRERRSIDDIDDASNYHVIYKTNEDHTRNVSSPIDIVIYPEETVSKFRMPHEVPSVVYPEIFVIVENSLYKAYGNDMMSLLAYSAEFWNSVDVRYRMMNNPKVRLHISGILIAEEPSVTPYILKNMYSRTHFYAVNAVNGAVTLLYKLRDRIPYSFYDVAVTLTRHQMDRDILGIAPLGGACGRQRGLVAHDEGRFLDIDTVAHELAHAFGVDHDGEEGATECSDGAGFIMAPVGGITPNAGIFSSCSLKQFRASVEAGNVTCLYNDPREMGGRSRALLLEKVPSLDEQCKTQFPENSQGKSCKPRDIETVDICMEHYCINNGKCEKSGAAALDGTPCGDEDLISPGICQNGKCVVGDNFKINDF